MSFSGVNTSGTNGSGAVGAVGGASASSGAPAATLVTVGAGSWVLGVGNDFDSAISRTLGTGQTLVHQYLATTGDTYWVQRLSSPVVNVGTSVTINDTAPTKDRYNLTIVEVVAATGTLPTYSISGTVSPVSAGSGASVSLSGASTASATADTNGNYTFAGLANGSYTVMPSKTGFSFSPASQPVTINGASQSGVNFTSQENAVTYTISGSITPSAAGSGAALALSGAASSTTAADASGIYSFPQLVNGTYTVTPSKNGFRFTPASASVSVNGADTGNVNFTAAAPSSSITMDAKVSQDGTSASSTITSPFFTTASSNELLLAFVATDYTGGTNTTVKSISGAGLTWTQVKHQRPERHV
jgi:hypothetical protein